MVNRLLKLSVGLALLAGCTGKPSHRTQHEGPQGTFKEGDPQVSASADGVKELYHERYKISEEIKVAQEERSSESALQIAKRLAAVVLADNVISNPSINRSSEYQTALGQFHQALILSYKLDPKSLLASGLLDRYQVASLGMCSGGDLSGCLRLPIFLDSQSALVMRILAEQLEGRITDQESLKNYYTLLHLSYELSRRTQDGKLDQLYVRHAREYMKYLGELNEPGIQDKRRRFRDNLTLALGHLRNASSKGQLDPQYCGFVEGLNPLNAEAFAKIEIDKRMKRSLTEEFIKCANQNGDLSSAILKQLDEKSSRFLGASASLQDSPFLYKNLDINLVEKKDIKSYIVAAFIIESLYYGDIDQNLARSYWKYVGTVNSLDFLKFILNFSRIQTAVVIKTTMKIYARVMREQFEKRKGLSSDYFSDVIQAVNNEADTDWDELKDRLISLREFLISIYDVELRRQSDEKTTDLYVKVKESLGSSFSEHLSLAVTTPMALPMYYYMAKSQGTIKFHIPWIRSENQWFDVPASDALQRFFRPDFGRADSLFKFGVLGQSLSPLQKVHVLDFALRIGVFEFLPFDLIEEDQQKHEPSEFLFFEQYVKDSLGFWQTVFNKTLTDLDSIENSQTFKDYVLNACQDPMGTPNSMVLTDLHMRTFLGDKAMTQPLTEIYGAIDRLFGWRYQRDRAIQILDLLKDHLLRGQKMNSLSPARIQSVQALVEKMHQEIGRYTTLERSLARRAFELDGKIVSKQTDCLQRLAKTEFFKRNQLMLSNIEYFKNVHAAMTILNLVPANNATSGTPALDASRSALVQSLTLAPDVKERALRLIKKVEDSGIIETLDLATALNETLRIHNISNPKYSGLGYFVAGVPTQEESNKRLKSLNYFKSDLFYQGRWDSLIRVRHQLLNDQVPAGLVNQALGTNYSGMVGLSPNLTVPLGDFGQLELDAEYKNSYTKYIPFDFDQDKFISSAVTKFAGAEPNGTQFISWFSTGGLDSNLIKQRLNWLKSLQSLGTIETDDQDDVNCPRDAFGKILATKDISGRNLPNVVAAPKCHAVRVSAIDLTEYYLKVLDVLRIDDQTRELVELMDRTGRLENDIKSFLQYRSEPSTVQWTYFDQFYKKFFTTVPAYVFDSGFWKAELIESIRGSRDFRSFHDEWVHRLAGTLSLFDIRYEPSLNERSAIRREMIDHLDLVMEFEEAVRYKEDAKIQLGDYLIERTTQHIRGEPYAFADWRVMAVKTRPRGDDREGTPIYLSENDRAKSWWDGYVESYVKKSTECVFLPTEKDPDYIQGSIDPDANCVERFKQWKALRESKRLRMRESIKKIYNPIPSSTRAR